MDRHRAREPQRRHRGGNDPHDLGGRERHRHRSVRHARANATFEVAEAGGGFSAPVVAGAGVLAVIAGLALGVLIGRALGRRRGGSKETDAPPPEEPPAT